MTANAGQMATPKPLSVISLDKADRALANSHKSEPFESLSSTQEAGTREKLETEPYP